MKTPDADDSAQPIGGETSAVRVLLVEDNAASRHLGAVLLTSAGYLVDVAEDGLQAVEATESQVYDLIFMDLQMPVMNGLDATLAIRQRGDANSLVPIIAVSANSADDFRERCREVGMNDFIAKPASKHNLVAAVEHWKHREVTLADNDPVQPAHPGFDGEILDSEILGGLEEAIGADQIGTLLDGYLADTDAQIADLRRCAETGNCNDLRGIAHDLKGAAANFGIANLRRLSQELEAATREHRDGDAHSLIAALPVELRRAKDAVAARYAAAAPAPAEPDTSAPNTSAE